MINIPFLRDGLAVWNKTQFFRDALYCSKFHGTFSDFAFHGSSVLTRILLVGEGIMYRVSTKELSTFKTNAAYLELHTFISR
jgi:hypothetical protein